MHKVKSFQDILLSKITYLGILFPPQYKGLVELEPQCSKHIPKYLSLLIYLVLADSEIIPIQYIIVQCTVYSVNKLYFYLVLVDSEYTRPPFSTEGLGDAIKFCNEKILTIY